MTVRVGIDHGELEPAGAHLSAGGEIAAGQDDAMPRAVFAAIGLHGHHAVTLEGQLGHRVVAANLHP
jgi:hypothetical protein